MCILASIFLVLLLILHTIHIDGAITVIDSLLVYQDQPQ